MKKNKLETYVGQKNKVNSLKEITEDQAKEFYEELKNKKEKGI